MVRHSLPIELSEQESRAVWDAAERLAPTTECFWWLAVHANIEGIPLSEERIAELRSMPDPRKTKTAPSVQD